MRNVNSLSFEFSIEGEVTKLDFYRSETEQNLFETSSGITIKSFINNDLHCVNAERNDENSLYHEYNDIIIDLFIDKYNSFVMSYIEDLEDGIETVKEQELEQDPSILVPYDPNSIRVTQGKFSLKEIHEMSMGTEYEESILDLSPDFQRNFVWDNTRKSRLIESILLRIPLPVFYLARDEEGKYQVVDGVQRLSVINEFFTNGFKLRNLEYLKDECNGKYFQKESAQSLHPKFVRHLRSYQVDCNIIEPDTPYKVKLDIFKRLNTGGRSLNNQEIRNSVMKPEVRNFIKKLAESVEFIDATNKSIKPKRMVDQELVLRFIGFYLIYKKRDLFPKLAYNGIMDEFLDNIVEVFKKEYGKIPFVDIENDFIDAMKNAKIMFGEYAFRKVKVDYEKNPKNMINKSLYTSFSVLLSSIDKSIIESRGQVIRDFAVELEQDRYLFESITYATNDKIRIDTTFLKIEEFINDIYGGLK